MAVNHLSRYFCSKILFVRPPRSSKPVHLHPCTRTIHHVSHPSHPTWQTCLPFVGISRLNMPGTSLSMSRALQRELRSFSKVKKNTILPEDATVGLGLLRPFAFTFVVCGVTFSTCIIWQHETIKRRSHDVVRSIRQHFGSLSSPYNQKHLHTRGQLNELWNGLSNGERMVVGVIMANVLVFLMWRVPAWHGTLSRYCTILPGNPSLSMVLASFSHFNLWHIVANMYVLWSFADISTTLFGREQWTAVYISSAVVSSFASLVAKVVRSGTTTLMPSLGASGAIMCLLGSVCVSHPDSQLSIAFVSSVYPHSFSANSALKFIIVLDTVGLLCGWKLFDHAAHLAGVLFGMWYATYGQRMVWGRKGSVITCWNKLKFKPEE